MNRLRILHTWLAAHSAYFFSMLAIFPEVWLHSADLQALLPATLVSRLAPWVAVIGFGMRLRQNWRTIPAPDETDKAGV